VTERCISCDRPLAADQRYCINCGERRGRSRLVPASARSAEPSPASTPAAPPPRRRLSAGTTLVAGVATLLLALGIGIEIGRLGNRGTPAQTRASAPVQVVTLGGSGGASGSSRPSHTPTKHKLAATKPTKAAPVHVTKKVAAKATAAAAKVLGSSSSNLPPPTVTVGGACPAGKAGCQNGHFTGNFFGP
jgi:hypothetical protein